MPRKYSPDARREALELFVSLGDLEQVAQEMRRRGYASYSVETLRRWRDEGGWEAVRAGAVGEAAKVAVLADAEAAVVNMLTSYQALRGQIQERLASKEVEFTEGVNLLVKIDTLIRALLAQQKTRVQQVDRPALALEVLQLVVERLADLDPLALELFQPHIADLGAALKARYAEAA
jgi:hypothetical protein